MNNRVAQALVTIAPCTVHRFTGDCLKLDHGFIVGGRHDGIEFPIDYPTWYLIEQITTWLDNLPFDVYYVGSWTENGILYIDAVEVVTGYNEAIELGRSQQQQAIYDLDNNRVVYVKEAA